MESIPDVIISASGGNVPLVTQSDANGGCANQFQVNETRDVVIQGDYYDGGTTVAISGQTVNSITVNSATTDYGQRHRRKRYGRF